MKKTDIILAVVALVTAAGIWLFYSAGADTGVGVEVTVDGESQAFLRLDKNDEVRIETEAGYNVVRVEDGVVFVTEADCRDQICVDHKHIDKVGENIVCLPHKMVVEITADSPAEGDFGVLVVG